MAMLIVLVMVFVGWAYFLTHYLPDLYIAIPAAVVATGLTFWAFSTYIDKARNKNCK